ncbi:MAG: tetratricopeptide repeat protein [Deltaproteobacteria bacterium]|nr:tetratricopeptide repeat protein [Deltaproteobacteria bacterium]
MAPEGAATRIGGKAMNGSDVFFCHAHQDQEVVGRVYDALAGRGLQCWVSFRDIVPGQNYLKAIMGALKSCGVVLLVVSRHSNESVHVHREVANATMAGIPVVPVLVEKVELSEELQYSLVNVQSLFAYGPLTDPIVEQIVRTLRTILGHRRPQGPGVGQPAEPGEGKAPPLPAKPETPAVRLENVPSRPSVPAPDSLIPANREDPSDQLVRERAAAREMDLSDDIDGAMAAYRRLLSEHPGDVESRVALAGLLSECADPEGAEALCREGLRIRDDARIRCALGEAIWHQYRAEEAIAEYRNAVALAPGLGPARAVLARALLEEGDPDGAIEHLQEAHRLAPAHPVVLVASAQAAEVLEEDRERASQLARGALLGAPRDRSVLLQLAALNMVEDILENGERYRAVLRRNPRAFVAAAGMAVIESLAENASEAKCLLQRALALRPDDPLVTLTSAFVHFCSGDWATTLQKVDRLVNAGGVPLSLLREVVWIFGLGGDSAKQHRVYRRILDYAPQMFQARLGLAELLLEEGNLRRAEAEVGRVRSRFPDLPSARALEARIRLAEGAIDQAESLLDGVRSTLGILCAKAAICKARSDVPGATAAYREALSLEPSDGGARRGLMECLVLLRREGEFRRAFADAPLKLVARMDFILGLIDLGNEEEAARELEALRGRTVVGANACFLAYRVGRHDLCKEFAEPILAGQAYVSPDLHWCLGRCHHFEGNSDAALEAYSKALREDPEHLLALTDSARLLHELGDGKTALGLLQRAATTTEGDKDGEVHCLLAEALALAGNSEDAWKSAEAFVSLGGGEEGYDRLALAFMNCGEFEKADQLLERALVDYPESIELRRTKAVSLERQDKADDALRELRLAEDLQPDSGAVHVSLGGLLDRMGRLSGARGHLLKAWKLLPADLTVGSVVGVFLVKTGDLAGARSVFEALLSRSEDPTPWIWDCLAAYQEHSQAEEGIELVRRATSLHPQLPDLWLWEGILLGTLGRHEDAIKPLRRSSEHFPGLAAIHLGNTLSALGRHSEAVQEFESAIEKDPSDTSVHRGLISMLRLRSQWAKAEEVLDQMLEVEPDAPDAAELYHAIRSKSSGVGEFRH